MTTEAQTQDICSIIENDCTAQSILCEELSDNQCIQGGLAVAAGIPLEDLRGRGVLRLKEYEQINRVFGLNKMQLEYMMHLNDSESSVSFRRDNLKRYVKTLQDLE